MASPQYEEFYQTLQKAAPFRKEISYFEMRAAVEKLMENYPAAPDITFEPLHIQKIAAFWIHAPLSTRKKVILFFHGGGYLAASVKSHQDFLGRLSRASHYDVLAIDYRLAPENPFPAALQDARTSYDWLLSQGFKPEQIILSGSSCGGGMVLSLLLQLKKEKKSMPFAGLCICPWVDLALTGTTLKTNEGKDTIRFERLKKAQETYLQGHDPKDPLASPLYGDLTGLPPLCIQVGSRELLLDEAQKLASKALSQGVHVNFEIFEDMVHTWHHYAAKFPEGDAAIDKLGSFVLTLQKT